jgi:hypothetical protein
MIAVEKWRSLESGAFLLTLIELAGPVQEPD